MKKFLKITALILTLLLTAAVAVSADTVPAPAKYDPLTEGIVSSYYTIDYERGYIMGIAPESVHLERLGIESGQDQHVVDHLRQAGIQYESNGWNLNFPNAYGGDDPIGCNERIGKAALRIEAERLANAFKVFKEDTVLPKWQKEHSWRAEHAFFD